MNPDAPCPVQYSVDYPDRPLNRMTSFFRLLMVIPIAIVLLLIEGGGYTSGSIGNVFGSVGLVVLPTLLLILFRQKYPRWWFDWNLELMRFSARVGVYVALMDDCYPSTDEHQAVHLEFAYPDARNDLNRWLPLVKPGDRLRPRAGDRQLPAVPPRPVASAGGWRDGDGRDQAQDVVWSRLSQRPAAVERRIDGAVGCGSCTARSSRACNRFGTMSPTNRPRSSSNKSPINPS